MSLSPDQKLAAYLLGRRIAGQRRRQERVPVAYLYNGVRLPGLPEYDVETYPYALITKHPYTESYTAYCFSTEPSVSSKFNSTLLPYDENGMCMFAALTADEPKFGDPTSYEYGLLGRVTEGTIWTNFAFRYKGTNEVYFEASEPVPVYE